MQMTDRLLSWASPRNVLLALVAFVGFSLPTFQFGPYARLRERTMGLALLDETFLYTPAQVSATLTAYGAEGRRIYLAFLLLDLLYPFCYAGALALLLAFTARRLVASGRFPRPLLLVPVAAGIGDWLENAGLLVLVLAYPARPTPLALLAAGVTATKLALVTASVALAAVGVLGWLARSISTRTRRRAADAA